MKIYKSLALVITLCSITPVSVYAQTKAAAGKAATKNTKHSSPRSSPRAAVLISTPKDIDSFLPTYLFEVAASVWRAHGYVVAPPLVSRAIIARRKQSSLSCATSDACVHQVAQELRAAHLAFVDTDAQEDGKVSVKLMMARVSGGAVRRGNLRKTVDNEMQVATLVRDEVTRSAALPPSCEVEIASSRKLTLATDAFEVQFPKQRIFFVAEGEHRIKVVSSGKSTRTWTGNHTCKKGRRARLSVF